MKNYVRFFYRIALVLLCLGKTGLANAQSFQHWLYPQYGHEVPYQGKCVVDSSCYDCGSTAQFSGDLTSYFKEKLGKDQIGSLHGLVVAFVMIDSTGHPCSQYFYNLTTYYSPETILALNLQEHIDAMPKWKPAVENRQKKNSVVMLEFRFEIDFKKFRVLRHLMNK